MGHDGDPSSGRRRPITGAVRAALAEQLRIAYENGASITALANATGRSYTTTRMLLLEAGARIRTPNSSLEHQSRSGMGRLGTPAGMRGSAVAQGERSAYRGLEEGY
jgi:hypothetical protein